MIVKDITNYGEDELSFIVFNEQHLYDIRHMAELEIVINDMYLFTKEQYRILMDDLLDDEIELMGREA